MVPIYANNTAEQAAYVLSHSDARVLFVDTRSLLERILASWPSCSGLRRLVLLGEGLEPERVRADLAARGLSVPTAAELAARLSTWPAARRRGVEIAEAEPGLFAERLAAVSLEAVGTMLYTSGTSGPPKGVPLTHRNVGSNGRDWLVVNAPLIADEPVDLLWLPFSHIFGFGEACLGNTLGFETFMCDPASVLARLPEVRPSVFMSVPSVWEKLAAAAQRESSPEARRERLIAATGGRMRFCLSGGAGLKREVKELFWEQGLLIIEGYGLTEASPTLTLNHIEAFRFDSVGRPLPSVELRLAEDGEILARGPNVFAGYHKDEEATRAVLTADGWLKTGDVGELTADGFLRIVDRKKDIFVLASGKNVPPANIEQRFADDARFAHVVLYGDGRGYLVAGVWLEPGAAAAWLAERGVAPEARDAALREMVGARIAEINAALARHETIKRFQLFSEPLTVEGGLLTATLKVKRRAVWERFRREFEAMYDQA
jgi:long-chain acyl-CoA synthetase